MCGIAGIWRKDRKPILKDHLTKMLKILKHRGPDAEGIWQKPGLALGSRRLKILDLSDAGNQPFTDGRDVLVFNGRIFNHLALKKELSSRFDFKTTCDTEVLFHALQVWDIKALNKIEGQFAFAFYKKSSQTLILSRDHAGVCPLYTMKTGGKFYFASEIKPLLGIRKCSLNDAGVIDFFSYRYNIQNGRTLFKEIKRFPPANFLKINLKTGRCYQKRYWRLEFKEEERSEKETQAEFRKILDSEIAKQSTADVPVGMYLSGGIDSGALLYGFSKKTKNIKTFTLRFSRNDSDYQRVLKLAKEIEFKKNLIDFSEDKLNELEEAVFILEEPFGDLIICANYFLAKLACQKVKVVLSGEGGDEAFCGYDHQRAFFKLRELSQNKITKLLIGVFLKIVPSRMLGFLQSYPGKFGDDELRRIRMISQKISTPADAYLELVTLFNKDELETLFSKEFKKRCSIQPDTTPIRKIFAHEKETWQAVMRCEIEQLTLIINLLKQDRFAMHFSMEGCVPLVSRRVLQFAASLPYRVHNSKVNKELLLKYSGQSIVKKKPFSLFATQDYLGKLIKLMDKYVTNETIQETNILAWDKIEEIRKKLLSGNILAIKQAMAILIFQVWRQGYENFIN